MKGEGTGEPHFEERCCLFQKMNMKLPKNLRDKDPLLGSLPSVDSAMEYSDHEWTTEELDAVDTQVLILICIVTLTCHKSKRKIKLIWYVCLRFLSEKM